MTETGRGETGSADKSKTGHACFYLFAAWLLFSFIVGLYFMISDREWFGLGILLLMVAAPSALFAWEQYSARKRQQERDRVRRVYSYLYLARGLCAFEYSLSKHLSQLARQEAFDETQLRATLEGVRREIVAVVLVLEKVFTATFAASAFNSSMFGVNVAFQSEDRQKVRTTLANLYGAGSARMLDPWADDEEDPMVTAIRSAMDKFEEPRGSGSPRD